MSAYAAKLCEAFFDKLRPPLGGLAGITALYDRKGSPIMKDFDRQLLDGSIDVAFVRGNYTGSVNHVFLGKTMAYAMTKEPLSSLAQLQGQRRLWYSTNEESHKLLQQWWAQQFGEEPTRGESIGYIDVA